MARPRVDSRMTTAMAARELGMGKGRLIRWVARGAPCRRQVSLIATGSAISTGTG